MNLIHQTFWSYMHKYLGENNSQSIMYFHYRFLRYEKFINSISVNTNYENYQRCEQKYNYNTICNWEKNKQFKNPTGKWLNKF